MAQNTYYWVGGLNNPLGINTGANWNTMLNGSGTSRPASANALDVLIIDGSNLGGATPVTGNAVLLASGGVTAAQLLIINGAKINMPRPSTGTSTITLAGAPGEDFIVSAGCEFNVTGSAGSIRVAFLPAVDSARVSGKVNITSNQQFRFDNGVTGTSRMFRFTSGASLTCNITSTTSSYIFGSNTQSSSKWVVFEDGSDLFYDGGFSANGSNSTFQPIDFRPNSTYHHRANNGAGSFFSRKDFGNIIVENNATLTQDGPSYTINNFTVTSGSTVIAATSGITGIRGNFVVNGTYNTDVTSTNKVNFSGNGAQSLSGIGTLTLGGIIVSEHALLSLARDVTTFGDVDIFGTINFGTRKIINALSFGAQGPSAAQTGSGNVAAGDNKITALTSVFSGINGQTITGAGIPANTVVVNFSVTDNTIYLSKEITASGTAVTFTISSIGSTLQTASPNGFDAANGSVMNAGSSSYESGISYIIDASTTTPFGFTTATTPVNLPLKNVTVNAPFTVNAGINLAGSITLNSKMTLRPGDSLHLFPGANFSGAFSASNYVATDYVTASGLQSFVLYDAVSSATVVPVGTTVHYLPVNLTPVNTSNFIMTVFTGITTNGEVNGTQLLGSQKQLLVDAIWKINRASGTGDVGITLNWPAAIEGSTFSTLPNSDIGLIKNTGTGYSLPVGSGNNIANTVTGTDATFGSFSAGSIPQADPFIFNAIPPKTYGAADFNGGAISQNTTQPVVYSSSNTAVATITAAGLIHIVGAGTTVITASQATDGFYPAASKTQTLVINKAALSITADSKTRFEQTANPALTITYTGFVLGETAAAFTASPTISTTATTASAPGIYPITAAGATSPNYEITFVNGTMTVLAKTAQVISFPIIPVKTYGNANFTLAATSSNSTTPITYSSSNSAVATIAGNVVTIIGAGTTTITANQTGSAGFFAATPQTQTLTVNKKALLIRVLDTTKIEGTANPSFAIIATGFVLGDTIANLATPPVVTTDATTASLPGVYSLTLGGATSNNYNISYINGKITIVPSSGTGVQYINAYGNAGGNINVRIFSPIIALSDIIVYNKMGQAVARKNILVNKGFTDAQVSTAQLASGIYVVRVFGRGIDLTTQIRLIK